MTTMTDQKKKILVVDDDRAILEVVTIVLSEAGYTVLPARDVTSGKKILEKEIVQVALVDLWLGKENCESLIDHMKRSDKTKSIPVIILSAVGAEVEKKAKEIGASDFLSKPFDINDLVACVEKYS